MNRNQSAYALAGVLVFGAMILPNCSDESSICGLPEDKQIPKATFDIVAPAFPVTAPYKVTGSIASNVAIEWITVGGVLISKTTNNYNTWEVTFDKNQLEAIREGNNAKIDVFAVTVCDSTPIKINSTPLMVPIGGNVNVPLAGLQLGDIVPPNDACYLPKDGSQSAMVRVTAEATAVGAAVQVSATNGTVVPAGEIKLVQGDGMAFYDLKFTGNNGGIGGVYVSAQGDSADPKFVTIADPPLISGGAGTPSRGKAYPLYVHSRGKLAQCSAKTFPVNAATVTITNPPLGPISGDMAVQGTKKTCAEDDSLEVHVVFGSDAPAGAQVMFECKDTWAQLSNVATLMVGDDPVVPLIDLDLMATIPAGECYLPANGNATATVRAVADIQSVGAAINVIATHGIVTPNGTIQLLANGNAASYDFAFTGNNAGFAILTAAGQGTTAMADGIVVAAAPTISPPTGSAKRGTPYALYVRSDGNLATCQVEATYPSTVTTQITNPPLGTINDIKVVKEAMQDCSVPELLRLDVLFAADAPDGSQLTVRCFDTWNQAGQSTVTVAPTP